MSSHTQNTVNVHTKLYGILGNPVDHSLSPLIQNAAFSHVGLNAAYLTFPVQPGYLGIALEGLHAIGLEGANITIPYKEEALDFIDDIPEDIDRATGAINTIHNRDGKFFGYNTDGPGFLSALNEELSFNPEAKTILVLGAGGAARGVIFSLARAHADKIWILNRNVERAQGLAEHAAGFFPETEFEAVKQLYEIRGEKIGLVINATSCGMKDNQEIPFDLRLLEERTSVYDLVYMPTQTPFLKTAHSMGFRHANGLGMLVNQAALSFKIWTGKSEGVHAAMRAALKGQAL